MTHTEEEPELDPDFDQELDALVPEAWANPFDVAEPDLISFETFFRDEGRVPVPESCRTDPLQEAAAELALAQKRLDGCLARFLGGLTEREIERLSPHDQCVVRTVRALPEAERRALSARFSDPRFGLSPMRPPTEPPKRRPYEPPSLRTVTLGNGRRRAEALRALVQQNLGAIDAMDRMLDDCRGLRLVEPERPRASEPPSRGAGEPPSRRASEPRSPRAVEPPESAALPFEPKIASPWPVTELLREPVGNASAGARSCRWCREAVDDDFDHDFCEPHLPDDELTHPELGGDLRAFELRYRENVRCACCESLVAVELVAPRAAAERGMCSATTVLCPFGSSISLAYSWKRRRVVGLRMTPPARGS